MAVTDYQSLYGACNKVAIDGISSIQNIGGYETYIELHSQDDIDNNWNDIVNGNYDSYNNLITSCYFGNDEDQSHIILIASDNVEIPEGYILTPVNPKKSLVILCNKFVNNGTVSMTGKGPNILPHDYYIMGQSDGYDTDIIVPAYANNQTEGHPDSKNIVGKKGNDGVNRNCGAGGIAGSGPLDGTLAYFHSNGSGYAFGGGAGSGGCVTSYDSQVDRGAGVDTTYPMRGGTYAANTGTRCGTHGGTGNPSGPSFYIENPSYTKLQYDQPNGVGGRIIIFCSKFINNGVIESKGTNQNSSVTVYGGTTINGGASGGGAVDVFYNTFNNEAENEGTILAEGGYAGSTKSGGDGSITLTQYNASSFVLPGYANKETISEVIRLTKLALKEKADIVQVPDLVIDDLVQSLVLTYSSDKIEELIAYVISRIPTLVSQLENDKGYIAREISPTEIENIWNNVFEV